MSRLEEVEAEIANLDDSYSARTYTDGYADLARTLAAEVDARDEVIGRLLEMLKPDGSNEDFGAVALYRRACEIAGRTE